MCLLIVNTCLSKIISLWGNSKYCKGEREREKRELPWNKTCTNLVWPKINVQNLFDASAMHKAGR